MPVLTPLEGRTIFEAAQPSVHVIGRARLDEILAIVQKLHDGMQAAEEQLDAHKFMLNAFWLASSGRLTMQEILDHPRLSEEQREDLLVMASQREDAQHWRDENDPQSRVDPISL